MSQEFVINKVRIPQITTNDTEVTLVEWYFKDEESVQIGDIIFSIETAKSITDIESEYSGQIVRLYAEKDVMKVGEIVAFIGADLKYLNDEKDNHLKMQDSNKKNKVLATKKAIQLADELKVEISSINKDGIIRVEDIEKHHYSSIEKSILQENEKFIELTNYQKGIIKTISWQKENAVVGYIEKIINIKIIKEYSEKLKKNKKWIFDPFFPIIAFYFSRIIKENNNFNTTIKNGSYCKYGKVNLGFTLDVEDKLLIAVLSSACEYEQDKFIENMFSLQKKTISGNLMSNEIQQPTIGITSLSSHSISRHIPILLPYTSIMFALSDVLPDMTKEGIYSSFGITYDHRVHSGTQISQLLNKFDKSINSIKD